MHVKADQFQCLSHASVAIQTILIAHVAAAVNVIRVAVAMTQHATVANIASAMSLAIAATKKAQ